MKELREILRNLRVDHDLTQETVAGYLGIEQQSYSNYENGNRTIPLWVVVKLAAYYQVSTDYLLSTGHHLRTIYLDGITLYDVLYKIQQLNPDDRRTLLRFLDYLKYCNK